MGFTNEYEDYQAPAQSGLSGFSTPFNMGKVDLSYPVQGVENYDMSNTQMGPTMANQNAIMGNQQVANDPYQDMQMKLMESQYNASEMGMKDLSDYRNSTMGQMSPYIKGFGQLAGGLGSIASIYTGFKTLGLMEDQVDIAKDKWAETKKELANVQGVRKKLNTTYMG